jgi:hypothetical protein
MPAAAHWVSCSARQAFPGVHAHLTLAELTAAAYYSYLALYNAVYVLPLLAIVVVFVVTLGTRKLQEEEGRILKLLSGMVMLGLGLVLLCTAETLSQPLTALALILTALAITALVV